MKTLPLIRNILIAQILAWWSTSLVSAQTVRDFDTAAGTPYVPTNCVPSNPGATPPQVLPGGPGGAGNFLRLIATSGPFPMSNSITFNATDLGLFSQIVAEFDFRMTPASGRADGLGFALLNTANYGNSGGVCPTLPPNAPEDPNFSGSLGVGFDIYKNINNFDINNNNISIHFDGTLLNQFDVTPVIDLAGGQWIHAKFIMRPGGGFSDVSVILTPFGEQPVTVIDNFQVQGFNPYAGRVFFGARSGSVTTAHDIDNINVQFSGNLGAAVYGQWSGVIDAQIVAVHLNLLPTGKVLYWQNGGYDGDPLVNQTRLWDPVTQTVSTPALPLDDIFCAGHSFLADGGLLVTGGHDHADGVGLRSASIYNAFTNFWTPLPDMNAGRWYPTNTTLANGDALVISGSATALSDKNTLPQVWQPASGSWRNLTGAQDAEPHGDELYPRMFLAPDGRVFKAGMDQQTWYLNTSGVGAWIQGPSSNFGYRTYGSAVMYDAGKILIVGGGDPPTASAEVIDLNAPAPTWRSVAPMAFARRHLNATLLADGKVLVTSGTASGGFNDGTDAVQVAEIWNPATETWSTMAAMQTRRVYHSTALLLPDGRVFVGGGGRPAATGGIENEDFEIYSPPYLFQGTRPTMTSAPATVGYGQTFFVQSPDAAGITNVNLIRLSAVTHAFDQNQRLNKLSFSQVSDGLNVTAPTSANLAPPGHYMLFILNGNGIPSEAKIIQIATSLPTPILSINDASVTEGNSGTVNANFTVTLSASSGQIVTVNYATANGTATAGSDYVSGSGTVTFPAGATTQTLTVAVNGDALDEPNETFFVNLSNATNATIADNQGQGTITDDDATPAITINDVSVTEGNAGTVNANFTVTLSAASGQQVTVNYATADGSASAGSDYVTGSVTVTFAAGSTTQTIAVIVNGDAVNEPNETFFVNLSNPINATIADNQGQGTIINDDTAVLIWMPPDVIDPNFARKARERGLTEEQVRNMAAETESHLALQAALLDHGKTPVNVADLTTVNLSQFEAVFAVLGVFPNNHRILANSAEALALQNYILSGGKVYMEGGDVWYSDPLNGGHDFGPLFGISGLADGSNDLGTILGVTGAFTQGLHFTYSGLNNFIDRMGSPINGAFTIHTNQSPAYNSGIARVNTANNSKTIGASFEFGGLNDNSASIYTKTNLMTKYLIHFGVIGDVLAVSDATVTEGNTGSINASFTAALGQASSQTITVNYATANGTATAGSDYVAVSGLLTFPPGVTSQTITVSVPGDLIDEADETFFVNLSNPVNAIIADNQGQGKIIDNDGNPNLALDRPATASSSNGTYPPGNAVDGSTSTHWRSGSVSSTTVVWWRVDLGATYNINNVIINWRTNYYARKYTVQVSLTGDGWMTVYTDNPGNGGIDNVSFVPQTGRYVRIRMTQNNSGTERLNEVEVYAASSALGKSVAENGSAAVIPDKVVLHQNYPNPFSANGTFGNPSTEISYSVPSAMHVKLTIYNLTGQEVATLVDKLNERGNYTAAFDASRLKSGLYFSVLQAGEVRQVRRLVFLK